MNPIHLLCAADAAYGPYAGIMLSSILRSNPGEIFDVHLLSNGVRPADLRKLAALARRAGSRCDVYDVARRLESYPDPAGYHLTRTAYARLLTGELLPARLTRLIYLDCDVICQGRLAPLWELGDMVEIIGAVPDRRPDPWRALLGLMPDAPYFNTGMLLINLEGWRRRNVGRELLDWITANPGKIRLADQDAINVCLGDAITPLPDTWNLQIGRDLAPVAEERIKSAALLHYAGQHKPWRFRFDGPGAEIFRRHKRASPWRFTPPSLRITYRLRKSLDNRLYRRRTAPPPAIGLSECRRKSGRRRGRPV
jgi:lipopolysaccharide biosynthesis glycosyltransferase